MSLWASLYHIVAYYIITQSLFFLSVFIEECKLHERGSPCHVSHEPITVPETEYLLNEHLLEL